MTAYRQSRRRMPMTGAPTIGASTTGSLFSALQVAHNNQCIAGALSIAELAATSTETEAHLCL